MNEFKRHKISNDVSLKHGNFIGMDDEKRSEVKVMPQNALFKMVKLNDLRESPLFFFSVSTLF